MHRPSSRLEIPLILAIVLTSCRGGSVGTPDAGYGTGAGGSGGIVDASAGTGGDGRGGGTGTAGMGGGAGGSGGSAGSGGAAGTGGSGGSSLCVSAGRGEMTASLAGTWTFTPSGAAATTIEAPGGGWVAQGFGVSAARYERMATVPNLGRPQATYVEFGVINHQAALSIDGNAISTNTTSFTPSVFEVTRAVTPGNQHRITIDVKGRDALTSSRGKKLVPDAAGWSANVPQGIFRSATVRAVPQLHVADAFVRTDVAADRVSVDVWVRNSGATQASGTVSLGLSSWNCEPLAYPTLSSQTVTVPAGQTVKVTLGPVAWGLGPSSYWWPNVPYVAGYRAKLHYASVTVTADAGGDVHTVPVRFGFRQIRQTGTRYELNGVRVNFRGDNLQGANYDSINTGRGVSDAYDMVPGFLPPSTSTTNPGWPRAVDYLLRLNYNVSRIHQEPASPYMLDVMDEMGLMVIDESAIRGSNNDQDFIDGLSNMTAHVQALVQRDRNHPAIIRWSQANESEYESTNSTGFQLALYQAITAVDDSRPVSADSAYSGSNFDRSYTSITASNFTALEHYPGGLGVYTEQVLASATRPFGVGEYIWPKDQTAQGFMWFATATMAMRQKDASDLRPYTLLSGWASFVPGIRTTMMTLEPTYPDRIISPPLYGEDNLPDPWSNPIIIRIQRAFNPVLAADLAYWNANRMSNASGAWPVALESIARGARTTRTIVVFNDTFSGTAVDVAWEMRADSATGAVSDQGQTTLTIPLGQRMQTSISVLAPQSGTRAYLVLRASKNGQELFREDAQAFTLQ
jgi:hypothetical protein